MDHLIETETPRHVADLEGSNAATANLPGIDAIPQRLDSECDRVTAEAVARYMWVNDMRTDGTPGQCRFCRRQLPVSVVALQTSIGPAPYPVLQCQRVTQFHQQAIEICQTWKAELVEKAKAASKETSKKYEL